MFAELLKAAREKPEQKTHHNGRAKREHSAFAAERNGQRHSDQRHDDDGERRGVLSLQSDGEYGRVGAARSQRLDVFVQPAGVQL